MLNLIFRKVLRYFIEVFISETAMATDDDAWVFPLLESLQQHPQIWDKETKGYKNSILRKKLWDTIADEVYEASGIRKTGMKLLYFCIGIFSQSCGYLPPWSCRGLAVLAVVLP